MIMRLWEKVLIKDYQAAEGDALYQRKRISLMFRCSLTNDVEEQLLGIEDHGDS